MSLLRNKKAVEGLPLKYIIIALVAALVVGIALQFTGTLRGGIQSTADQINTTIAEKTTCELDSTAPRVVSASATCSSGNISITATITDDCGTSEAWAYAKKGTSSYSVTLKTTAVDDKNAVWTGYNSSLTTGAYSAYVYAKDKSTSTNTISTQSSAFEITGINC